MHSFEVQWFIDVELSVYCSLNACEDSLYHTKIIFYCSDPETISSHSLLFNVYVSHHKQRELMQLLLIMSWLLGTCLH